MIHRMITAIAFSLLSMSVAAQANPGSAHANQATELLAIIHDSKLVDLTHAFSASTPVWSGFGQASITPAKDPKTGQPYTIAKDGFRANYFSMVGQYGTHVDPPAHFDAHGATIDAIPLNQMILPLVVFDITGLLHDDPDHALSVNDILDWEKLHGRVPSGSFAALRTDMSKDWDSNPARFKRSPFPAWSLAAVKFLIEQRGVVAIGHESLDTDTTPGMDSETWLLRHGHYQIEAMAHLDQVPATGAVLIAMWPKVKDGDGFPARVMAVMPAAIAQAH
ncbi:MAG TPA: cyclase family protein [Dyella sp.]|uniref:cyclase family protein n=1 Tax=Dyella sp. TaxID=1869338 RepID=UPI002BC34E58|nr:cyclase family protein [Dyella sp.]HUB89738.1 cyclase family protein [Dyella sp.]